LAGYPAGYPAGSGYPAGYPAGSGYPAKTGYPAGYRISGKKNGWISGGRISGQVLIRCNPTDNYDYTKYKLLGESTS